MTVDDAQIGKNLARLRGGRSQKEVADLMRQRGFRWSQATVWSIEKGERPLRLSEATALTEVLELQNVQNITAPENEFEYLVTERKLRAAERELALQADAVIRLQRQMVEELNDMYTKDLDADVVQSLEWTLRFTPVEIVYDVLVEQIPLVRALTEQGGPFGAALLEGMLQTELKTALTINFGKKDDVER